MLELMSKQGKLGVPSVTLWLLDGSLVHEDDIGFFAKQLSASEARRYGAFARRERKRQFLLGRMLLRLSVARLLSLPPDALDVVERDNNAPQLMLPGLKRARPSFSLSHSGDWVACAISPDVVVGVDIEVNKPTRNVFGMSRMAFDASEHFWLMQQSEATRLSAFYQLWCTREALYKLKSASGREIVSSPLVDADDLLTSRGDGWCGYTLAHCGLTISLCSDQPLSTLWKVKLAGLSRADWLALGGEFLVSCNT